MATRTAPTPPRSAPSGCWTTCGGACWSCWAPAPTSTTCAPRCAAHAALCMLCCARQATPAAFCTRRQASNLPTPPSSSAPPFPGGVDAQRHGRAAHGGRDLPLVCRQRLCVPRLQPQQVRPGLHNDGGQPLQWGVCVLDATRPCFQHCLLRVAPTCVTSHSCFAFPLPPSLPPARLSSASPCPQRAGHPRVRPAGRGRLWFSHRRGPGGLAGRPAFGQQYQQRERL